MKKINAKNVNVAYGSKQALFDINIDIEEKQVTALIGPSGCGKSTFLRCLNRMNDVIDICKVTGEIYINDFNILDKNCDVVRLREKIGMVFQKPNPFPKTIYENIAYGPTIHGMTQSKVEMDEVVETSLKTRIQVEHPVSELVTNNDLISLQIMYALNPEKKTLSQNKILSSGHALECRVYAEDPSQNFLPSPGKITTLDIPTIPAGIRLDWGFEQGDEISFYYDPMIGKVIAHDLTREDAITKLIDFLQSITIEGIKTNIPFLISLLKNKSFIKGKHNTKYIENNINSFTFDSNSPTKNYLNNSVKINRKQIKIVETDKTNSLSNKSKILNGEKIKIVHFN